MLLVLFWQQLMWLGLYCKYRPTCRGCGFHISSVFKASWCLGMQVTLTPRWRSIPSPSSHSLCHRGSHPCMPSSGVSLGFCWQHDGLLSKAPHLLQFLWCCVVTWDSSLGHLVRRLWLTISQCLYFLPPQPPLGSWCGKMWREKDPWPLPPALGITASLIRGKLPALSIVSPCRLPGGFCGYCQLTPWVSPGGVPQSSPPVPWCLLLECGLPWVKARQCQRNEKGKLSTGLVALTFLSYFSIFLLIFWSQCPFACVLEAAQIASPRVSGRVYSYTQQKRWGDYLLHLTLSSNQPWQCCPWRAASYPLQQVPPQHP